MEQYGRECEVFQVNRRMKDAPVSSSDIKSIVFVKMTA
jgi:hypothetical protein